MINKNNKVEEYNLEVFIAGELIDLCIPTKEFAENSNWFSWFNDKKTTRFLEQGIFPNTPEEQIRFYNTLGKDRLSLIISDRERYLGTISLSSIDLYKRTAEVALLIGNKSVKEYSNYFALEAMALITEHGFRTIGLNRISAGQHILLRKWQNRLEILGYKLEGIKTNAFIKGSEIADAVFIAVTQTDYEKLAKNRGGKLWDGLFSMEKRMSEMNQVSPLMDEFKDFFLTARKDYYEKIFNL